MELNALQKKPLKDFILYSLIGYAFFSAISITLAELFLLLGLGFWIADVIKNKIPLKEQFKTSVTVPIAVFLFIHLLSAVLGIDPLNSLKDYKKVYIIFMFFLSANYCGKEQDVRKIVNAFISGAVIVGVYCTVNTIYHRFGLHEMNFRASSFSGNHMHAGGMLMMACVVSAAALAHEAWSKIKNYRAILLYALAFIFISAGLMFTYTRGSWLAAFLGVIMIALYTDKRLLMGALVVFVMALFILKDTSFMERAKSAVNVGKKSSANERLLMWKSGLLMIKDRPLIGIGSANVDKIYPKYRLPESVEPNQGHLHNNIIQLAVIDGIPGALAYLWIFTALAAAYISALIKRKTGYMKTVLFACFSVSAGFFINGFFEYNFFSSQPVLMFWFLSGLGFAIIKSNERTAGDVEKSLQARKP